MKHNRRRTIAKTSIFASICFALLSFSVPTGGDLIEIFLNKKMVLQQFVHNDQAVKTLSINPSDIQHQLEVSYKHCGVIGKGRSISIKNQENKIVKTWHFTDATGKSGTMIISVKDLFPGKNKAGEKVHLYYSSKEMPKEKLLANVILQQTIVAKNASTNTPVQRFEMSNILLINP